MNSKAYRSPVQPSGECLYGFGVIYALKLLYAPCLHRCNKVKLLCNFIEQKCKKVAQLCATKLNFCATLLNKSARKFTQHEQMQFQFFA